MTFVPQIYIWSHVRNLHTVFQSKVHAFFFPLKRRHYGRHLCSIFMSWSIPIHLVTPRPGRFMTTTQPSTTSFNTSLRCGSELRPRIYMRVPFLFVCSTIKGYIWMWTCSPWITKITIQPSLSLYDFIYIKYSNFFKLLFFSFNFTQFESIYMWCLLWINGLDWTEENLDIFWRINYLLWNSKLPWYTTIQMVINS